MRLLAIIFILLSLSCSINADKYNLGYFSDIQINLDTLVIDPNDQILYTNTAITGSDISLDKNYLYNFNSSDHTLEQINLNELILERKLPFEKEGPNGTGEFVSFISIDEEKNVLVKGMNKSELFNLKGEKLRVIDYEYYSLGWDKGGEVLIPTTLLDPNVGLLFVIIKKELEKSYCLGILDIESNEINSIPLETFQGFKDNTFTITISNATINTPQGVYLRMYDGNLILSTQVDNELLIYNIKEDRLYPKSNNSQLYAERKIKEYQFQHESFKSKDSEYKRFHQEINYLPLFWDEKNQIFFRFSYELVPSESKEINNVNVKTFLTALNKDFNLIGEMLIPSLTLLPLDGSIRQFPKHFAKDGKIWIYENINDEMGFVVMTLSK